MGTLTVVVGGQFGSEGKGAVVAHLSGQPGAPRAVVRVAGPNAGHTVIGTGPKGEPDFPWRLRAVPVAAVTDRTADLFLAAGSEVELAVLHDELAALDAAGYRASVRMFVDASATILTDRHKAAEGQADLVGRIGSTGKGIGAARADRIMRTAQLYGNDRPLSEANVADRLVTHLADGGDVIVEGTQGYGLGLHAGYYPKCTSSDCRAIDFLAMAGISPWGREVTKLAVAVVARTYPIRVAGDSGPMHDETSWEALGLEPELTTVTRKVRRVGMWDGQLVASAVEANGGNPVASVALTMLDQVFPEIAGKQGKIRLDQLSDAVADYIGVREYQINAKITLVGTGPATMLELVA